VQNPPEADLCTGQDLLGTFEGKITNCDEAFGSKDSDDIA